jgi:hypothetical protein
LDISPYFLALEALMVVLLILCLIHAWQVGLPEVFALLAGVIFGVILEVATIHQLQAYQYGQFMFMVGEVPLAVGIGWGVIIYSARLYSDMTNLPWGARPALDGLLALNIDLAMDTIAIRLGMWDWGQGLDFEYFGVPWANFWAWFWVVFTFSLGLRLFRRLPGLLGIWTAPFGAIALGSLGVLGTNYLIVHVVPHEWYELTIFIVLGLAMLGELIMRPAITGPPTSPLVLWVPLSFHIYFLLVGLMSGVVLWTPFLLLMSLLMLVTALFLHRPWTWNGKA